MQAAYEVLSDPQERAWYDSHKDAILHSQTGDSEEQYERNVKVTTADDILRMYLKFNYHFDFTDSPNGFYSVLGELFGRLAREEELACEWQGIDPIDYPRFGSAKDEYDDTVKSFYSAWSSFSSQKSFAWKDLYRLSDAPDRRTRRAMEKENKRRRNEGLREFNEAVQDLVAYIRRRDPRYTPSKETEAQRQQRLRESAAAQAARSRIANLAKFSEGTVPDWTKSREQDDETTSDDSNESIEEHFECVTCRKSFKSEGQYEAHEKSKKHIKAVHMVQREMRKENKAFGLETDSHQTTSYGQDQESSDSDRLSAAPREATSVDNSGDSLSPDSHSSTVKAVEGDQSDTCREGDPTHGISPALSAEADGYTKSQDVEGRISGQPGSMRAQNMANDLKVEDDPLSNDLAATTLNEMKPKIGKAKEKRAKKAAQRDAQAIGSQEYQDEYVCSMCQAAFSSRNKLFGHIQKLGHVQLREKASNSKAKKR